MCVATCTYNSIINSSLGYSFCSYCDIQSLLLASKDQSQCVCADQYYKAVTGECLPCDYTCASCSDSKTCLTCDTVPSVGTNRILQNGKCVCPAQRFYDSASTQDAVCAPCNYSCLSCQNAQVCTSCSASSGRFLVNGSCICPVGLVDNGKSEQCQQQNTTTSNPTANSSASSNTSGNTSWQTTTSPPSNNAPNISANSNTTNTTSSTTAQNTSTSSTIAVTTPPTTPPLPTCKLNELLVNNSCQCKPTFQNISGVCQRCEANKYFNGSMCIVCSNGTVSSDGTACTCNDGFFMVQNICQQPPSNQTYNGSAFVCKAGTFNISGVCTICPTNQTYDNATSTCVCRTGFFKVNGSCLQPGSNQIYNGSGFICSPGYYLLNGSCGQCPSASQYNGSACVCTQNNSYFTDAGCVQCQANSRVAGLGCQCNDGFSLVNGTCVAACPKDSTLQAGACVCNSNFLTLRTTNGIYCQACPPNSHPNSAGTGCLCNPSFFLDFSPPGARCSSCNATCAECTGPNSNQCLSCSDKNAILSNGICTANICPGGYYLNLTAYMCFSCLPFCNLCANNS